MIIVFRCSSEARRALEVIMEAGGYSDYSDVINAALMNYAALSSALGTRGAIVLPESIPPAAAAVPKQRGSVQVHVAQSPVVPTAPPPLTSQVRIPTVFARTDFPNEPHERLADLPSDVFLPGQPVPVDRWIFGQYSKLLPVKASCRAMANLLLKYPGGFPETIAQQLAQEAALLGEYLKAYDQSHGFNRDEALATGFPSGGASADKSRLRYANQFVASMNKHGQLSGLLAGLKLINITNERAHRIQLTKPGWAFAILQNPILDGQPSAPTSDRLSNDERELLLDHIARCVPVEDYAIRTVLASISAGLLTPDALDGVVKKLPVSKTDGVSELFIRTQRSGLISRVADLGLVTRERDGVRVSYAITRAGKNYMSRTEAA